MPVDTKYKGYDLAVEKSTMVRDFASGEFVVKEKGEKYLPKLGGQNDREYDAYKTRGYVIPAVEPTSMAIIGSIMRKEPAIETSFEHTKTNIDGDKTHLKSFVSTMIRELLYAGGIGYLVEFDESIRLPVVKTYKKESLINFSKDYIVLSQEYTTQGKNDKFQQTIETEYLELTFDEDKNYIQNIWRKTSKGLEIFDTFEPTSRGDRLKEIPFVFCSEEKTGISTNDPILLHLASVNADQYRLSTDQRHGLHWTALPTLFLFGELTDSDGKKKQITVGAGSSNHIEDNDARAELLEFTGAGLGSIKAAIDDDISTMASIGAKMLVGDSGGVKAAETARIDASSETATLSVIANSVDLCVNEILDVMARWMKVEGEQVFAVNRDFIDIKLDPAGLMALLKTWQSGGMSLNSFLHQLEKGEVLPKGVSAEDEADRIEQDPDPFADNSGGGF